MEKLKEFFDQLRSLKERYDELSTKNKVFFIISFTPFLLLLLYSITRYTGFIDWVTNLKTYKNIVAIISSIRNMPLTNLIALIVLLFLALLILFRGKKTKLNLEVYEIKELAKPDVSSNYYRITLLNPLRQQVILKSFNVKWKYYEGMCCSIGHGIAIKPVATYLIDIPLDTRNENTECLNVDFDPIIVIPPKDKYGKGFVQFNIQFHYHFNKGLNYHPCEDWNIFYSLDITDKNERKMNIFTNYSWRVEEELEAMRDGRIKEYADSLNKNY